MFKNGNFERKNGVTQWSKPIRAELKPPIKMNISMKMNVGLTDTTPAPKYEKFMIIPKKAAAKVNVPKINPKPTNNSPHATANEKKPVA